MGSCLSVIAAALAAVGALAGQTSQGQSVEHHDSAMVHDGALGAYPMSREASGTAWQPESTPMSRLSWRRGEWTIMTHGFATAGFTRETGSRGDSSALGTGMVMGMAHRPYGNRTVSVRGMATLEPIMGPRGYPLLLQNGETADGVTALVDRQHPHDAVMELSVTISQRLAQGRSMFLYVAPVGEPPLGPAAFMHRTSAAEIPQAPISHHWLDSTHISHGVVTLGFATPEGFKAEVSAFNGREPDHYRWGLQAPTLNSFAGRLTINPTANVSVQFSGARLDQPEQLHGNLDVIRITASATYNRPLADGNLQITGAWGRSKRLLPDSTERIFFTHDDQHVHFLDLTSAENSLVQDAWLLEASARLAEWHTVSLRLEQVNKDDLFPSADVRHANIYDVARVSAGYVFDLPVRARVRYGIGITASLARVPAALEPEYGRNPTGVAVFLRVVLGQ